MVCGTTGLTEAQQAELAESAKSVPIFWTPNMSIGINVLLQLLPELVRMLGDTYDMEMVELHHNKKKDAPSGTALKLAQCLARLGTGISRKKPAAAAKASSANALMRKSAFRTIRGGDVVGVHTVYFMGPGERIEVTHQAHTRENFAQGALRAAKWLANQPAERLYSMVDTFLA